MGSHVIVVCALAAACGEPNAPIRAVTLNIANGAGMITAADRARQSAFLAALAPDVVGMQEVEVGVTHSGGGNTAVQSTATMGGSVVFAGCASVDAYGRLGSGTGQAGVALWVRTGLTIVDSWMVPVDWELSANGGDGWPRCTLVAHVVGEGHDFTVAVSHLMVGSNADIRRRELQESIAGGVDILLMDANALGDEIARDMATSPMSLCSGPLFPGCVDQAWTRDACSGRLVPTHGASDHPYAALAEVAVP